MKRFKLIGLVWSVALAAGLGGVEPAWAQGATKTGDAAKAGEGKAKPTAAEIEKLNVELGQAVAAGKEDQVKDLLGRGAEVDGNPVEGRTMLTLALEQGVGPGIIKLLLEKGADANKTDGLGWTPLRQGMVRFDPDPNNLRLGAVDMNDSRNRTRAFKPATVKRGDPKDLTHIRLLLSHGAKPESALVEAAAWNRKDLVLLLLEHGASVNEAGSRGYSPLWGAATEGHDELCVLLLDRGADLKYVPPGPEARSLLSLVIGHQHASTALLLIARGADLKEVKQYHIIMPEVVRNPKMAPVIDKYIAAGLVDWTFLEDTTPGDTLFHKLASTGNVSIMRRALEGGADVNHRNLFGVTPLGEILGAWPQGVDCLEVVKMLVEHGAKLDVETNENKNATLLMNAVDGCRSFEVLEYLVSKGADLHAVDTENLTVMHYALCSSKPQEYVPKLLKLGAKANALDLAESCFFMGDGRAKEDGRAELLKQFLESGADANGRSARDKDPLLMKAIMGQRADMMEVLLKHGANVDAVDANGRTAMARVCEYAKIYSLPDPQIREKGDKVVKEMSDVLVAHKANVTIADANGVTPLHIVAQSLNRDLAELLIKQGADVNARDKEGRTPLDVAKGEMLSLLKEKGAKKGADLGK